MRKPMTGAEVGTVAGITAGIAAGITAGISITIAGLLAREYFFHIALDASTDKSALLKPTPDAEKEEKVSGEERNVSEAVIAFKAQYEGRKIASFDRLRLHGYLYGQKKPNKKRTVLIRGYGDSGIWFGREAPAFYRAGLNLLLPGVGGHGKSRGTYVGMGWHDRLDTKEWICQLTRQYPDSEAVLCGVSMGAVVVMIAAGEKPPSDVEAAAEGRGYTPVWSVLSYQMKFQFHLPALPFLYCADFVTRIRTGYGMKEADVLECVAGIRLSTFLIHGTEDRFALFEMTRELYDTCRGKKECLAVVGMTHVQAALVDRAEYWDRVLWFVDRYLERQQAKMQTSED